jgi:hypothetical protein
MGGKSKNTSTNRSSFQQKSLFERVGSGRYEEHEHEGKTPDAMLRSIMRMHHDTTVVFDASWTKEKWRLVGHEPPWLDRARCDYRGFFQ